MSALSPAIAVLLVNYGSSNLLRHHASAWRADHICVWVVDNYSTAEERINVTELATSEGWNLLTPTANLGFAAGINLAAQHACAAGADVILVVNPDVAITLPTVRRLAHYAVSEQCVAAPQLVRPDGSLYSAGHDLSLADGTMRAARHRDPSAATPGPYPERWQPWLTAAVWMIPAPLWQRVGPMNEQYFLYWEDVDWCVRAQQLGVPIVVLDDLTAEHDEGGTHVAQRPGGYTKSTTYVYYCVRNRLLFAQLHLTWRRWVRWWLTTPTAVWTVLGHGGRRGLLLSCQPWVAAAAGVFDAVRGAYGPRKRRVASEV